MRTTKKHFVTQTKYGLMAGLVLWGAEACSNDRYDVNVTGSSASDGLDLKAVGALVQDAKDAESFERLLNDPSRGVNNLDLDEDGNVDYIKVTEFGDGDARGFALTTELAPGDVQEIATVNIVKAEDRAEMEVRGNQHIYGHRHYYHSHFGLTDMLLFSYLFRPHAMYVSPWGYGAYPGYWGRGPTVVTRTIYRDRVRNVAKASPLRSAPSSRLSRAPAASPHQGKASSRVRAPLKAPTASQRRFQARNPSKTVRGGGFGRRGGSGFGSVRRGAGRRSGGAFGGK